MMFPLVLASPYPNPSRRSHEAMSVPKGRSIGGLCDVQQDLPVPLATGSVFSAAPGGGRSTKPSRMSKRPLCLGHSMRAACRQPSARCVRPCVQNAIGGEQLADGGAVDDVGLALVVKAQHIAGHEQARIADLDPAGRRPGWPRR